MAKTRANPPAGGSACYGVAIILPKSWSTFAKCGRWSTSECSSDQGGGPGEEDQEHERSVQRERESGDDAAEPTAVISERLRSAVPKELPVSDPRPSAKPAA